MSNFLATGRVLLGYLATFYSLTRTWSSRCGVTQGERRGTLALWFMAGPGLLPAQDRPPATDLLNTPISPGGDFGRYWDSLLLFATIRV